MLLLYIRAYYSCCCLARLVPRSGQAAAAIISHYVVIAGIPGQGGVCLATFIVAALMLPPGVHPPASFVGRVERHLRSCAATPPRRVPGRRRLMASAVEKGVPRPCKKTCFNLAGGSFCMCGVHLLGSDRECIAEGRKSA